MEHREQEWPEKGDWVKVPKLMGTVRPGESPGEPKDRAGVCVCV